MSARRREQDLVLPVDRDYRDRVHDQVAGLRELAGDEKHREDFVAQRLFALSERYLLAAVRRSERSELPVDPDPDPIDALPEAADSVQLGKT